MKYDHLCPCGNRWEVSCSIHDEPDPTCPECGAKGCMQFDSVELMFPGSWWSRKLDEGVRDGTLDKRSKFSNKVKVPKRYLDEARAAGIPIKS